MIVEVAIGSTAILLLGSIRMALRFVEGQEKREYDAEGRAMTMAADARRAEEKRQERAAHFADSAWCRSQHASFDARRKIILERRIRWRDAYESFRGTIDEDSKTRRAVLWAELCRVDGELITLEIEAAEIPRHDIAGEVNTEGSSPVLPPMAPSDSKETS